MCIQTETRTIHSPCELTPAVFDECAQHALSAGRIVSETDETIDCDRLSSHLQTVHDKLDGMFLSLKCFFRKHLLALI